MPVQLTGPYNCAECGTGLTIETVLDGDAGPLAVNIRGHRIEIPGLYVCTNCAGAIMVGERETGVTLEAIVAFFEDNFGPRLVEAVFLAGNEHDAHMIADRLVDVMELQTVLEAVILLKAQPGGLDFIPECEGKCGGHQHGGQDKNLAHLS